MGKVPESFKCLVQQQKEDIVRQENGKNVPLEVNNQKVTHRDGH
jgi:hypothetical protein